MSQDLVHEVDSRLIVYYDEATGKWHPAILPEAHRADATPLIQPFVRFTVSRTISSVVGAKSLEKALVFCAKRATHITPSTSQAFPGPKRTLPSIEHVHALHALVYQRLSRTILRG